MTERQKKKYDWAYKAFVIAVLTAIVTSLLAYAPEAIDAINNRTFDSTEQKMEVITSSKEIIDKGQEQMIMHHVDDQDSHMSFEEKATIIRIEENQKRIGQDLQEIKNLIRQQQQ